MTIDLFGLPLQVFGLCMAIAAVIAFLLARANYARLSVHPGTLSWVAVLSLPLMVLFARLAYCLADYEWVSMEGVGFILDFSRGGYMLYGAVLGMMLALLIVSKITKEPFARLADGVAMPGLIAVALGRLTVGLACGLDYGWGIENWFMEDSGMSLFVWEDPSLLYRLPFGIAGYYGSYSWAVFVLEALIALVLAAIVHRADVRRDGGRITLALIAYAATQALCESMRQDAVLRWGFVRINQILGGLIVLGLLILCFIRQAPRSPRRMALSTAGVFLCAALVIAMEFALEKKISAIEWMPMDVCYLLMAVGCIGMILIVLPMWRSAYGKHAKP